MLSKIGEKMNNGILQDIINEFSADKFVDFFRQKNNSFEPKLSPIPQYNNDKFSDAKYIGDIPFDNHTDFVICSVKMNGQITERSGKKAQYESGKSILKYGTQFKQRYDAGIFIFYDKDGNFRFSLIYIDYVGPRRKWSIYKRFTYYVSKNLTNKTFLQQIGDGDFSSLEKIKEAFSVEPVTRQFYSEIQNWFYWAFDKI